MASVYVVLAEFRQVIEVVFLIYMNGRGGSAFWKEGCGSILGCVRNIRMAITMLKRVALRQFAFKFTPFVARQREALAAQPALCQDTVTFT